MWEILPANWYLPGPCGTITTVTDFVVIIIDERAG